MQCRTIGAMIAAEMEALVEKRESVTLCLLVRFVFGDQSIDLRCNEPADRCLAPRSQNFRLSDRLPIEAHGKILRHVFYV
jgi:hypothetical protein